MAPLQDFITETESARICGVSVSTLNRFIETGYLQVEFDNDGLRLFSKAELKRVFGISEEVLDLKDRGKPPETFSDNTAPKLDPAYQPPLSKEANERKDYKTGDPSPRISRPNMNAPLHPHLKVVEPTKAAAADSIAEDPLTEPPFRRQPRRERSAAIEILDAEVLKLKNVVGLLEKILEIRESEIESLKKQNSWLQERVERMEERSSREQLLLLAESETVRKLITQQKRSSFRAALEWLGLSEPVQYKSTIDL